LGIIAAATLAWLAVHAVLSPVNPRQQAPEKHYDAPCWACHFVIESVEVRSLAE
jgi:hypothetical protein